jgi:glucose-induced degradation protein 8
LDKDPQLHFSLLRLQLVELIRSNHEDPSPALEFATAQLGPRAPTNKEFLHDLEQTMSLLFFSPDKLPAELKYLLEPGLRRNVADEVNKAILQHQRRRREAAIRQLVKMRAWAENTAREYKKDLPDRIDLGIQGDSSDSLEERAHENGHEPMITT